MSKLLIPDYPLMVLPKLAVAIGLNEALFLQQVHYWIADKRAPLKEGRRWHYESYKAWLEQFPFWSSATLRRIVTKLRERGLLIAKAMNEESWDQTLWYSIDYEKLEALQLTFEHAPSVQNEQLDEVKMSTSSIEETKEENSNSSEAAPRKYKHQPALAADDVVVAKILEKAAAMELPSQPVLKLVKKYGRGQVDVALDLLAKKENITNPLGWLTEAVKEGWVDTQTENAQNAAPKPVSPAIEAQQYLIEKRGTKLHEAALLKLAGEGIHAPLYADYKSQEYEIFYQAELKFNLLLVAKMKKMEVKDVNL